MGIQNVVRWASLEINYPGVSSPSQPWLGGPVQVAPASDYWSPNVKPPAQNFNYLFAKEDAQAQYAYSLAVSVAANNWSAKTAVTSMGVADTPINFAGFAYDTVYGKWVGAVTNNVADLSISVVQTFDGGRTWTLQYQTFSAYKALAFAIMSGSTYLIVDQTAASATGWTANAISGASDTQTARTNVFTSATALVLGSNFYVYGVLQSGGTFTGYLESSPDGITWTDQSAQLATHFASGTNHVAPLLRAVGAVAGVPTAVVAICGATAGTDTARLMKFTVSGGVPTCTEVSTSPYGSLTIISGIHYNANEGLWAVAFNNGGGGDSSIYTSPDLSAWTEVFATSEGIIQGVSSVGDVWATTLGNGYVTQVLISGNVATLGGSSTWSPTCSTVTVVADGKGGLFSSGNQLLAASDTVAAVSLKVGFDNDTPAAPFAEPFGNAASSARTVFVYNNVDGVLPATTGDIVIAFEGLTGPHQATLPPTPAVGQEAIVVDADGSLASHNFTVVGNGNNINGASPLVMTAADPGADGSVSMIFISAAIGWRRV